MKLSLHKALIYGNGNYDDDDDDDGEDDTTSSNTIENKLMSLPNLQF